MKATRSQRKSNEFFPYQVCYIYVVLLVFSSVGQTLKSKYVIEDNCSIAQISDDGYVIIFGKKLYWIEHEFRDYRNDFMLFYVKEESDPDSLNQAVDAKPHEIRLPLNISSEIMQHFREIKARMLHFMRQI